MPPPPTSDNSLTAVDYLKFSQMIHRIRALEHLATEHFFRGNSYYRGKLAEMIRQKTVGHRLLNPDASFFDINDPSYDFARADVDLGHAKFPADAFDRGYSSVSSHGCTFPYCPTSTGTCELCGLEEMENLLIEAAEAR